MVIIAPSDCLPYTTVLDINWAIGHKGSFTARWIGTFPQNLVLIYSAVSEKIMSTDGRTTMDARVMTVALL